MLSIGFVLLTHANQDQVLRLVTTLNDVFDRPPIACHHDFSKEYFDVSRFPANVKFVPDYILTRWGGISLVEATFRALQLLYAGSGPDWFYLLSGSDYPIQRAAAIRTELLGTSFDAFIRTILVDHSVVPRRVKEPIPGGFGNSGYTWLAYERYITRSFPVPAGRHRQRGPTAKHISIRNPRLLSLFHPFDSSYKCFAGDQWFAANGRSAEYILRADLKPALRYFRRRHPPDEAVFQTVLGNAPGLKLSSELKHFIVWEPGRHPRTLECSDIPAIQNSKAHFARKFAPNTPILDALDAYLRDNNLDTVPGACTI